MPAPSKKPRQPTSSSSRRTAAQRASAERSAAARARIAARERRRRLTIVFSSVATVLVIVAALIVVKVITGSGSPKSGVTATAAQQQVITAVTSVPATVLNEVGVGTLTSPPKKVTTGTALTDGGKPEVLYVGAEYCPYCATERWAAVVALSRFGTFTNLGQTASSPSDVYPSTATLTFHGASFSSPYLSFTGKEIQSNKVVNGNYTTLDTLTTAEQSLVTALNKGGGIPFIDIGGKYYISGATYDPAVLKGKTHAQIAAALSDPTSPIAKGADGSANVITAAICAATGNKPAAVCTSAGVKAAAAKLGNG